MADFEQETFKAEVVYTYSRYTRLFVTDPRTGKRQEVQCSCLDSCSRAGAWLRPRAAQVTWLQLKNPRPAARPLLVSISVDAKDLDLSYSYSSCLQ